MAETLSTDESKNSFFNAESYENTADVEIAWVGRAVEHMEVHFNLNPEGVSPLNPIYSAWNLNLDELVNQLITSVNPMMLRLTPYDDEIYNSFKEEFPEFKLDVLQEESLKCPESKKKWNKFCSAWKEKIDDALFGTLVRIDSSGTYSEENTIFVVRIQFLAIEIARNKLGLNNTVYENKKTNS